MHTNLVRAFRLMLLAAAVLCWRFPALAQEAPSSSKSIATALQPFVERHELAGAVALVANKDKVLSIDAVGFADVAANKPMKADTIFWIASQSKPITAAALMMLVDEGKVKLDDPVSKFIPEFNDVVLGGKAGGKPATPITVRHVLSHTSGLPFKSALETPTLDLFTLKERAESYAKTPLQSEPGTKYAYSNAGINTAGRIIEVVSGMSYEDFLDKRLFGPLGMKDTTFWPNEEQVGRIAKSYTPTKDKKNLQEVPIGQLKYPLNDRKNRTPMPAGGLFATAADVALFCQMLLNNGEFKGKRFLSPDAVKEMTSKQTGTLKDAYGLGLSVGNGFGHGGAHATNMSVDPKKGLVYVWMVQETGGFPGDGGKAQGEFRKAADAEFGSPNKK
jgi:CubicO group peptidase (beta-lactamase class C family)